MCRFPRPMAVFCGTPLVAAAVAASLVAAPSAARAARPPASPPAQASSRAGQPARAGAAARPVLLVTGQRLLVGRGPGGRPEVSQSPAQQGSFYILLIFAQCLVTVDVPLDALPYLGRGLDPSLFSLRALRRAEHGGRLPVQVSFRGRRPALPGVRVTRSGRGSARGYLTPASARVFGAALARQFRADHARGSYGADGMFAGGVRLALAGAATRPLPARPARPARPRFRLHTLTVRGTNLRGRPDYGDTVTVMNADNCARLDLMAGQNVFYHGVAKLSVPSGHYWLLGNFVTTPKGSLNDHIAVQPEVTVRGSTTVSLAARSATSRLSFAVPRPAAQQAENLTLARGGRAGSSTSVASVAWIGVGATRLWVSPTTRRPATAALRSFTSAVLTSPPRVSPPYAYNLDFAGPPGTIPAQRFAVTAAGLAAVTERYYQDRPATGAWTSYGATAAQLEAGVSSVTLPLRLPGKQVQYFSASRGLVWTSQYWEYLLSDGSTGGGQADPARAYRPGERLTQDWNRYPLHPQQDMVLPGTAAELAVTPSAYRTGDTLVLGPSPFSDNQPGHLGTGLQPDPTTRVTASYRVDQNGARIAGGSALGGVPPVRLSARPALVRFTLTADRESPRYVLSPASTTVWTWRSRRNPSATVPAGWACFTSRGVTSRCAVQPLMTLGYRVRGLGLGGLARPGRQAVGVTVGHLQLASAYRVTGAAAQVSFNRGFSWRPARVTGRGRGRFLVAFRAPAGVFVTLRFAATDAAGGSISETVLSGYGTAAAAPPVAAATTAAVVGPATAAATAGPAPAAEPRAPAALRAPACAAAARHRESCFLRYLPQYAVNRAIAAGSSGPAARPRGWGGRAIERAYRLPVSRKTRQTVAVSIPYNTPHLASYMNTYRRYYGLPACTVASGCFRVVNQAGQASPLPLSGTGTGWDLEATLDVSMVSVACPHCKILVVEARNPGDFNLAETDVIAARLHAQVTSNSYGQRESGYALRYARYYHRYRHVTVAAAGDFGYTAASFPADLSTVTAVGGTELARARGGRGRRGWTERVWNTASAGAGGSGCSAYVRKPAWQRDRHCPGRTVADVAAVAWNVPIYNRHYGGWVTVGGTSVSAPLVAGVYGLAGNASRLAPGYAYTRRGSLFDVTAGNNAWLEPVPDACSGDYLCVARRGYDAPTGLGTPDGIGAF